jgi:hypothetical protein
VITAPVITSPVKPVAPVFMVGSPHAEHAGIAQKTNVYNFMGMTGDKATLMYNSSYDNIKKAFNFVAREVGVEELDDIQSKTCVKGKVTYTRWCVNLKMTVNNLKLIPDARGEWCGIKVMRNPPAPFVIIKAIDHEKAQEMYNLVMPAPEGITGEGRSGGAPTGGGGGGGGGAE